MATFTDEPIGILPRQDQKPPQQNLVLDIIGHFNTHIRGTEWEILPFRHVSGPLPGYECGGAVRLGDWHGNLYEAIKPKQSPIFLKCEKCGLQFNVTPGHSLSFCGAHYATLVWKIVQEPLAKDRICSVLSPFFACGEYPLGIRTFDQEHSPTFEEMVDSLVGDRFRSLEYISKLAEAEQELSGIRKYFRNKHMERAREIIRKVTWRHRNACPGFWDGHAITRSGWNNFENRF